MAYVEGTHRDTDEMSVLEALMNAADINEHEIDKMYGQQPESDSEGDDSS